MKENIYDNSNIAESYAGVTTPLTFSFVSYVYREVYRYFSKMMGTSDQLIKENKDMFEHMVEFIGYIIYYNLNNWYTMLSFFPGHRLSGEFMEKMMGVDKHNPLGKKKYSFYQKYLCYFPKTVLQIIRISLTFLFLGRLVEQFNTYFDKVFSEISLADLNKLTLVELKKSYRELDNKLLSCWKVPIANDFAVMVSAGLTDRLFKIWLDSNDAYSFMRPNANKPLISLDPGNKVLHIVNFIKKDQKIRELFLGGYTEEHIIKSLHDHYATHRVTCEIDAYLKKFGTRMPNELKLESETLSENPKNFIALIKTIVQGELTHGREPKMKSMKRNYDNVGLPKRVFLQWLLGWAGNAIRRREEARFRRTLIFGYVRKIFLSIGKKFRQKHHIKNKRDIFYLSVEEIFNRIDTGKKDFHLRSLIEQRKHLFKKWQNLELPRRFETAKSIHKIEQQALNRVAVLHKTVARQLIGSVASRPNNIYTFSGTALTLKDFDAAANFEGRILVTRQTDPGWTIIFPLLRGIVVERGGMLSHAAIVARELHIPCIVGVEQATDFIPNGAQIALDLQTGLITNLC